MEKSSLILFLQCHLHKRSLLHFFNLGERLLRGFPFQQIKIGAESLKIGIHLLWVGDLTEVKVSELVRETLVRAMLG